MLSTTASTLTDFCQDREFTEYNSNLVQENASWFPGSDFTLSFGHLDFINFNNFPMPSFGFPPPISAVEDQITIPEPQISHRTLPRTRRSSLFPVVQGNNKFGRRGKRRCLHCRHWRQKCAYIDLNLPCTSCATKGLPCGPEQKLLAREVRNPSVDSDNSIPYDVFRPNSYISCEPRPPIEDTLPSLESGYLEFFWLTSSTWFDLLNDSIQNTPLPLAICASHRFGPHISSPLVRSVILSYSSYRKDRGTISFAIQYLCDFCKYAREAIDQGSYIELLYGCYLMCAQELSKRNFTGDFQNHAQGFLLCYRRIVTLGVLTLEEEEIMQRAYNLILQMTKVATSEWHEKDNWRRLTYTIIQRLDSAAQRGLSIKGSFDENNQTLWIPASNSLAGSEWVVDGLCTRFTRLSMIRLGGEDFENLDDIVGQIALGLETLRNSLFIPKYSPNGGQTYTANLLLDDGLTYLQGDQYTRQLLTLYYILLSQYRIMVLEWTESSSTEVVRTSQAICRLFPPPHETQYPAQIRFWLNRGLFIAGIIIADTDNCKGSDAVYGHD